MVGICENEGDGSKEGSGGRRHKIENDTEEVSKRNEFLSGLEGVIKDNNIDKILNLSDACMRQYIHYYFQKRVINLTKAKQADLKKILYPLLV